MNEIDKLKEIREDHLNEIDFHKEKVTNISEKIIAKMKKQKCSFEDVIFHEWLEYATKKDFGCLHHIEINGKDIWGLIDHGEPSRGRTYTIDEITNYIFDQVEWEEITEEVGWKYCKKLMEDNVGSMSFDW